jgi:hypothetical protein
MTLTPRKSAAQKFYGKYRGIVTATDDIEGLGRIKARVPAVAADADLGWAMPCVSASEYRSGILAVPPLNAAVWIEFEGGDLSRPIWTGLYWTAADPRPNVVTTHMPGS